MEDLFASGLQQSPPRPRRAPLQRREFGWSFCTGSRLRWEVVLDFQRATSQSGHGLVARAVEKGSRAACFAENICTAKVWLCNFGVLLMRIEKVYVGWRQTDRMPCSQDPEGVWLNCFVHQNTI